MPIPTFRIDDYFSERDGEIRFSRVQASDFAKQVAGDFNPIHDADAKLFCVPGDLLFAVTLARFGVSQRMAFSFTGMVDDRVALRFDERPDGLALVDGDGRRYLEVEREGAVSHDSLFGRDLTCRYVAFSGHNFPDLLIPLMASQEVMINPDRPLVIYERMELELDRLELVDPAVELSDARLEVVGRKGQVQLAFTIHAQGRRVGGGAKFISVRGLRGYDQAVVDRLVADYLAVREAYGT